MNEALYPILARLRTSIPAWDTGQDIQIERIGGLTNTNYRIQVNGERFVLRVSGNNTHHLGINRIHESNTLRSAAALGLGPEVIAFLLPEGHLLTRSIDGRHWSADEFRNLHNVRLLTETVKRVHAMPLNGAVFSPFQRTLDNLATARSYAVPLPAELEQCIATLQEVEAEQQHDKSPWQRFCHNDLVSVNYLYRDQEPSILLLDWEFAGLGDIYYDLATIVYTHDNVGPISADLEQEMLASYFGTVTLQQHRRLDGMKFMLMFFTASWGLAQHAIQSADLIPAPEGFDYLEFAQYLFKNDLPRLQAGLK